MCALLTPRDEAAMAGVLAEATAERRAVRIAGAGTKGHWGAPPRHNGQILISTRGLDGPIDHRQADFIAEVGAGVSLGRLQHELADVGQTLALDPPRGADATLGGIFATADSGPLAHRYGSPRDQILAIRVALGDGRIVRAGAAVPRQGAGPELPRLFCGSFGCLGVILSITVRLIPLEERTATVTALSSDPARLSAAAQALARSPLEFIALDFAWRRGRGGLLARTAGPSASARAERAGALMSGCGLDQIELTDHDEPLWARQRSGQRSPGAAVVRVHGMPGQLPGLLALADACNATVVGRAARGVSYLELAPARADELVGGLASGLWAELLDRGGASALEPTPATMAPPATLALMRAVKGRLDPGGICNPGLALGGL